MTLWHPENQSIKILLLAGNFSKDYKVFNLELDLSALGFQVNIFYPRKYSGKFIKTFIHDFKGD